MSRQAGLYAQPALYDILYTPGTAAEVDTLERVEATYTSGSLLPNRLWFEPACGTGRYLRVAQKRGRRVAGFDLDEHQLDYAAGRLDCPRRHLFVADMVDFKDAMVQSGLPVGKINFAFNPVNSLRHLPSDGAVIKHLTQMAQVMAPGGLYVVGLSLVDYEWLFPEEDTWVSTRGRCRVTQLVNYVPPEPDQGRARREQVISHLKVDRPSGSRHFDASYDLHCFDRQQWHRVIARSALNWIASCDSRGQPLGDRTLPYQLEILRA